MDKESYAWCGGQAVASGETYIHSAFNKTDQNRIIFFCDIEQPLKCRLPQWVNRCFKKVAVAAAATQNEAGETVGFINKVFGVIYIFRSRAKRLKKSLRNLYYALKWLLIGLVGWYLFTDGMFIAK